MIDLDTMYRREVLAVGAATLFAGCSRNEEASSTPGNGQPEDSPTSTSTETASETSTAAETRQDSIGEDFQYSGEQAVERVASQTGEWMELEHPSQQFDFPVDFEYLANLDNVSLKDKTFLGGSRQVDAFYLILDPASGDEVNVATLALDGDAWDPSKSYSDNINETHSVYGGRSVETYSPEQLQVLFSEDITGYDDASEDFPQEYLDLIEG